MRQTSLLLMAAIVALVAVPAYGQTMCGDVTGDAQVNVSDLVYLLNYIYMEGPPPPDLDSANVDLCDAVDVADISHMVYYIFQGGPPPCTPADCNLYPGGSISVHHVDGAFQDKLVTGVPITFYIRIQNDTPDKIQIFSNGLRVHSPDGATWTNTNVDTTGTTDFDDFDNYFQRVYNPTGSGADTLCLGAWALPMKDGFYPGFDLSLIHI